MGRKTSPNRMGLGPGSPQRPLLGQKPSRQLPRVSAKVGQAPRPGQAFSAGGHSQEHATHLRVVLLCLLLRLTVSAKLQRSSTQAHYPRGQAGAWAQPRCDREGTRLQAEQGEPSQAWGRLQPRAHSLGRRPVDRDAARRGRPLPWSSGLSVNALLSVSLGRRAGGPGATRSWTPLPRDPPWTCMPGASQSQGSSHAARHTKRSSHPAVTAC